MCNKILKSIGFGPLKPEESHFLLQPGGFAGADPGDEC